MRKSVTGVLMLLAASIACASTFDAGLAEFKAGRYSGAYGRFVAAANAGDPDAARFALFMVRYGPAAYGSHWGATPDEVAYWTHLTLSRDGRAQPAFKAVDAGKGGNRLKSSTTQPCRREGIATWPSDC